MLRLKCNAVSENEYFEFLDLDNISVIEKFKKNNEKLQLIISTFNFLTIPIILKKLETITRIKIPICTQFKKNEFLNKKTLQKK